MNGDDEELPPLLFHGSPRAESLLRRGLRVATIANTDDDFDWLDRVVETYVELDPETRALVRRYAKGRRVTRAWLRQNVSLAWFTELENLAATFGTVLVADMSQIPRLWWFRDDLMPWSYVLVLPKRLPQAPASAFRLAR